MPKRWLCALSSAAKGPIVHHWRVSALAVNTRLDVQQTIGVWQPLQPFYDSNTDGTQLDTTHEWASPSIYLIKLGLNMATSPARTHLQGLVVGKSIAVILVELLTALLRMINLGRLVYMELPCSQTQLCPFELTTYCMCTNFLILPLSSSILTPLCPLSVAALP